jgi:hypothetical protein
LKYLKRLMNSFCDSHSWVGWFLFLDRGSIEEAPLRCSHSI